MARTIRGLGYPARAHIAGSNYQIMLPPVAQDAGLGELGRNGYLISSRFGARFRLGAVTTDLPLVPDSPVTLGVQEFCAACRKCAVWFVLYGGTDPLLSADDAQQAFIPMQAEFFDNDRVRGFIAFPPVS